MKEGIREKPKIGEASTAVTQTPVQIALIKNLEVKDALLIVKKDAKVKYQTIIYELNLGTVFQVASYEEVYGSKKTKQNNTKDDKTEV